jgi:transcriptional regulator with XRE-family HTH domain
MSDDSDPIGARIRALRDARGLTQEELGRIIGVDETAVSKIENGRRGLAAAELAQICEHLEIRSDELLFGRPGRPRAGVLLRADAGADAKSAVERAKAAFADYRYVKALIES